jgi:NNP family nitrate/nitrite transporter-like MFS transporter
MVPLVPSYEKLLYVAFFLGIAGSSFAVGVGFVSRWFPPEKQGGALGIYGLGNIGQSAAVFLGPVLAMAVGWQNIFRGMAALLVIWGVAFFLLARNSPKTVRPSSMGAMLQLLSRERLSWVLSLFYFLTFWWICCIFDLLAGLAQRPVRIETCGRRVSYCRFCCAGNLGSPAGRLAIG